MHFKTPYYAEIIASIMGMSLDDAFFNGLASVPVRHTQCVQKLRYGAIGLCLCTLVEIRWRLPV